MKKLKILLPVLLIICLGILFYAPVVFAQARYGTQTSNAIETDTALVLPANTWVYSITIFADQANSFMGVYDSATLGGATNTTVRGEVGEATQYDEKTKVFSPPKLFTNGVTVVITTGVGFIDYGGPPI